MDKKNNEGKTFGDIFSNINDKDENKSISFNTIKNESDSLDDDLKMGDLFKKASDSVSNDDKNDGINKESTFNSIFKNDDNSDVEDDSLVEEPSFIDSSLGKKMDSIFDKATLEVNENDDKNISNEEVYNNIDTPISNDSEEEIENRVSENISSNEIEDSSTLDYDTNEDIFSGMSNLFLDNGSNNNDIDDSSIDDDSGVVDDTKEESNLVTDDKSLMDKGNIFFDSDDVDSKDNKDETSSFSDNIFFDSDNDSGQVDKNITFDDNKQDDEDKEVDSNLFFSDREDSESRGEASENIFLNDSSFLEEKDSSKDIDSDIGSSSPFFEEDNDKKEEFNPFFNSKINLIEESKYDDKNISNKIDTSGVQKFNVKVVKKKEPLIKFILGVLSYAVFIWLLLIGITLLLYVLDIKIRAAKGDTSPPKYNAYVVLTGSMLPEIQVYDVVITKKVDAKSLKENDIITFASADTRFLGTIITHRIVKKNYDAKTGGYTFQTKGDNNNIADSALVQPNNIYGKVILKIPKLGYLQEFLASDGGWILVILFPCLIVISYDIVKLSKGIRKKKYKNIKVQSR